MTTARTDPPEPDAPVTAAPPAAAPPAGADTGAGPTGADPAGTDPAAVDPAVPAGGDGGGPLADARPGRAVVSGGDGAGAAVPADVPDGAGTPSDVDGDDGEMASLSAALDADSAPEERRHWLRYPGLVGALAVVGMLMLVPCGAGTLFFTGAFADHGRFGSAPDACARLDPDTVRRAFGDGLVSAGRTGSGDDSTCTYQGSAAVGSDARVSLTVTRYGTKGPLSAPRMAHAGLTGDVTDGAPGRSRRTVPGLGDEAVAVQGPTGVTVYSRVSNVVLRLDATGAAAREPDTVAAARSAVATLT